MMGIAFLLMALGVACFALFGYLNFVLQPRWYPTQGSGARGAHMVLGVAETLLFLLGAVLFTMGSTIVGTSLGYGGG